MAERRRYTKIDEKVDKPKAQLAKYKWKQIEESLKKNLMTV